MNYLIRLDDACPNMNLEKWQRIISILDNYNIKSIIASIPDNLDRSFKSPIINNYDSLLIKWSTKHEIALHGYNHTYNSIGSPLYGVKKTSEFAGKKYEIQKSIILKGLKVFSKLNIYPRIFVAPGHSFDNTTVDVIRESFPEMIISDGCFLHPVTYKGVKFLPQQFANCRNIPLGVITFCYHPNSMSNNDFIILERFLKKNHHKFIEINSLKFNQCSFFHSIFDKALNLIKTLIYNVRNFSFK